MRKIFIQFYLLLIVSFAAALMMVGMFYKQAVEDVGERYLNEIFRAYFQLIEHELDGVSSTRWASEVASRRRAYPVKVEPLDAYRLEPEDQASLNNGDILMIEDRNVFLQRIPSSDYLIELGPIRYLDFLRQVELADILVLMGLGLFMGVPAFLWIRPLWAQLLHMESVSKGLARGDFSQRAVVQEGAATYRLATTLNSMAESVQQLLRSKKALIDAVSHELRTPIARLRYRIAALPDTPDSQATRDGMERDLTAIDKLIEEMLLYARLEHAGMEIKPELIVALLWLQQIEQEEEMPTHQQLQIEVTEAWPEVNWCADPHYMGRAVGNLIRNAFRHAAGRVVISTGVLDGLAWVLVEDDGPGVPEQEAAQVFEPFVRMDTSRDRKTGGVGLGLAIVKAIMDRHGGEATVGRSALGGAAFRLSWPANL